VILRTDARHPDGVLGEDVQWVEAPAARVIG